jgi:hypothetical protein
MGFIAFAYPGVVQVFGVYFLLLIVFCVNWSTIYVVKVRLI